MKQSWIIGVISIWLIILAAEMMASGGTAFSSTATDTMKAISAPAMVNQSGAVSALTSVVNGVATFFVTFFSIIFLWSPTVFAGNWIWFWQFVCFPIGISFIVVVVTILRGVHAS